jgi:hypothetical protein
MRHPIFPTLTATLLTALPALATAAPPNRPAPPPASAWVVEGVDYGNLAYDVLRRSPSSPAPSLKNGRFKGYVARGEAPVECRLDQLLTPDLNGDGRKDAVTRIGCGRMVPGEVGRIRVSQDYTAAFVSTDRGPRQVLARFCDGETGYEWATETSLAFADGALTCVSSTFGDTDTEGSVRIWEWQPGESGALVRTVARYWDETCSTPLYDALAKLRPGTAEEDEAPEVAALCTEKPKVCAGLPLPGEACQGHQQAMERFEAGMDALARGDLQEARRVAKAMGDPLVTPASVLLDEIAARVEQVRCGWAEVKLATARTYADAGFGVEAVASADEALAVCPTDATKQRHAALVRQVQVRTDRYDRASGKRRQRWDKDVAVCDLRARSCEGTATGLARLNDCRTKRTLCLEAAEKAVEPPPAPSKPEVREPPPPTQEWLEDETQAAAPAGEVRCAAGSRCVSATSPQP